MKRMFAPVAVVAILLGAFAPPAQADDLTTTSAADGISPGVAVAPRVIVNDAKVKVAPGTQPEGPQTFTVDSGKIYVEDRPANALRVYDLSGKFLRSVKVPNTFASADLAVRGSTATFLDIDGGLHRLNLSGSTAVEVGTSTVGGIPASEPDAASLAGVGVSHITYFGDQLVGQIESAGQLVLSSGSFLGKPVNSLVRPGFVSQSGSSLLVKSATGTTIKKFNMPSRPVQVILSHREAGFSYYTVVGDRQAANGDWLFDTWVYKFADSGQLVASYTVKAQSSYTPWREVAVSNGRVFQLLIGTKQAQVVELKPDDRSKALSAQSAKLATPQKFTAAAAPARIVGNVISRADKMVHVKWTFNKDKHGNIGVVSKGNRKWVTQAPQLKRLASKLKKTKKKAASVTAYPYAWGGYDTDKTHTKGAGWKSFSTALKAKKVYVSNVKGLRSHPVWVPGTAGVDCSGFVSSAFEVGTKRGTMNLVDGKLFKALPSIYDAKRGDILNRYKHHVRIVVSWKNATTIRVLESTSTVDYGKVAVNEYSVDAMKRDGYTAARYTHWVPDPTKCVPGIPCAASVGS